MVFGSIRTVHSKAFVGEAFLDDYPLCTRFDIRNSGGAVITGCIITQVEKREQDARLQPVTRTVLVARTPDGWTIELARDHTLAVSAGYAPAGESAQVHFRQEQERRRSGPSAT